MEQAVVQKMRAKIARSKYGEVFMVSSFPKFNVEYVTKLLAVFEKEGIITRVTIQRLVYLTINSISHLANGL